MSGGEGARQCQTMEDGFARKNIITIKFALVILFFGSFADL